MQDAGQARVNDSSAFAKDGGSDFPEAPPYSASAAAVLDNSMEVDSRESSCGAHPAQAASCGSQQGGAAAARRRAPALVLRGRSDRVKELKRLIAEEGCRATILYQLQELDPRAFRWYLDEYGGGTMPKWYDDAADDDLCICLANAEHDAPVVRKVTLPPEGAQDEPRGASHDEGGAQSVGRSGQPTASAESAEPSASSTATCDEPTASQKRDTGSRRRWNRHQEESENHTFVDIYEIGVKDVSLTVAHLPVAHVPLYPSDHER